MKSKVWNSALNSALLYSCETWFSNDLRGVETSYNNTLKQMLSVRQATCNDLVFLETGQSNAKSIILDRQSKFIKKIENGDYITLLIWPLVWTRPWGKRIVTLWHNSSPHRPKFMQNLTDTVKTSESSRRTTYRDINPSLLRCESL